MGHHTWLGDSKFAMVARPQMPLVSISHNLRPESLCVTREYGVRVLSHFSGDESCVHSAHHYRYPARPVLSGNLVGAARSEGFDIDRDQVSRFIVVDFIDAIIE